MWVSGTEQKPQIWSPAPPSPTVRFEPPRCNKVHVTLLLPPPPPLLHPSCCVPSRAKLVSAWSGESILTYIPEPGLTHGKKKKKTVTHSESWKPAHVRRCTESQLSVSLVQETAAVGGGGGVWRRRRGSELTEHGNGPEEKHSSDSRCGNTLFTHTHTLEYTKTQSWR